MFIDNAVAIQAIIQIVVLGCVAMLFKFLLDGLKAQGHRLEESWGRYTDKLTEAIKDVHVQLGVLKQRFDSDIETLSEEVSDIRGFLKGADHEHEPKDKGSDRSV